ncbi:MAG: hypothetical protein ACJAYU_003489 [Bradymonadia bacterium]|jgi:hypothetical protein
MIELAVVAFVAIMLLATGASMLLPWTTLFMLGAGVTAVGFVLGIPTGVLYHVQLHRCLAPRDELAPGWIWNPIDNHVHLRPSERRRVLPWCYAGALGFVVICLGMLLVVFGMGSVIVRGL